MTEHWSLADALRIMNEVHADFATQDEVMFRKGHQLSVIETMPSTLGAIDLVKRTVTFSFSSEEPVLTGRDCIEWLNHADGCMRTEFFATGSVKFLRDHVGTDVLGRVTEFQVKDRRGFGTAKIEESQMGDEYLSSVSAGKYTGISMRYCRHAIRPLGETGVGYQSFVTDSWSPVEISATDSPKDITAMVRNDS
jgi:hypothetical protein